MTLPAVCPKCAKTFGGWSIGAHSKKCGVTPADLFWQKVVKGDYCWIWKGSIKPRNGYGHFRAAGRDYNAHRFAWEQENGPIPKGMEVMHTCDVPACVNVAHMRLGTHQENMTDCKEKMRHSFGERNKRNVLTADQVRIIKAEYIRGHRGRKANTQELADRFGVGQGAIHAIMRGATWAHVK